jgi:hypothetical protein
MYALLAKCRANDSIPEELFRLVELIVAKLDGPFAIEDAPTRPERRISSGSMPATHFRKAQEILDGKEPEPTSKK